MPGRCFAVGPFGAHHNRPPPKPHPHHRLAPAQPGFRWELRFSGAGISSCVETRPYRAQVGVYSTDRYHLTKMEMGTRIGALVFISLVHVLTATDVLDGSQAAAVQNITQFWSQTNTDIGTFLLGWTTASLPCVNESNWNGIVCWGPISNGSIEYYYIIAMQISNTQLEGTLAPAIGDLNYLAYLTITENPKLTGLIPPSLTSLTRLNTMDLHSNNLTGEIPEWLSGTESLTKIDLHRNQLEGSIPDLSGCYLLSVLDLSENLLSGSIPTAFPLDLTIVQLSHNQFSGNISCPDSTLPAGLNSQESLAALNLSNNRLSGQLPECWHSLGNLITLDLSNNNFSGSIMPSFFLNWSKLEYLYGDNNNFSGVLDLSQLNYTENYTHVRQISLVNNNISHVILPSSNATSLLLGGNPVCNDQEMVEYCCFDTNTIIVVKKGSKTVIIVTVSISALFLLLASIVSFVIIKRLWRKVVILRQIQEEFAKNEVQPLLYSFNDLQVATQDFHPINKLGEGGFGVVYKGVLLDGTELAVKKLTKSQQGLTEFLNEIVAITGVRHRNLVKLKGCCVRSDQRILVYEYVENKNLAEALWNANAPLEGGVMRKWSTRFNIILGVAQGLAYLHKDVQPPIIHRDIKAPNILLNKDMEPKIGDFGLALLFPVLDDDQTHLSIQNLAGTRGYLAPEYAAYGQVSEKIDVFSFGVLMLEVVSGRKVIDVKLHEQQRYLLEWAWNLHDNANLSELIDPKLEGELMEEDIMQVIKIGLLCTQYAASKRPTMSNVVHMLFGHRAPGEVHRDADLRQFSTELFVFASTSSSLTFGNQERMNTSFLSRELSDDVSSPILTSSVQY